jgi:hypothetical protein
MPCPPCPAVPSPKRTRGPAPVSSTRGRAGGPRSFEFSRGTGASSAAPSFDPSPRAAATRSRPSPYVHGSPCETGVFKIVGRETGVLTGVRPTRAPRDVGAPTPRPRSSGLLAPRGRRRAPHAQAERPGCEAASELGVHARDRASGRPPPPARQWCQPGQARLVDAPRGPRCPRPADGAGARQPTARRPRPGFESGVRVRAASSAAAAPGSSGRSGARPARPPHPVDVPEAKRQQLA